MAEGSGQHGPGGRAGTVPPRDAATVMLLRPAATAAGAERGLRVYLLRRVGAMSFAPGAHVFPGGSVDPRDSERETGWAGPSPGEWARRLGVRPSLARALLCAAVRETFEESGVLLAGGSPEEVVTDTRGEDWEADRRALIDRSLAFAEFLRGRGLLLRSDLLRPWSRWVTPRGERRRYDTRFFAARLPDGQEPRDVGGEADRAMWLDPAVAVERWRRGTLPMLPPTVETLRELAGCGSLPEVMGARRELVPVEPRLREAGGERVIVLPDGTEYPLTRGGP